MLYIVSCLARRAPARAARTGGTSARRRPGLIVLVYGHFSY